MGTMPFQPNTITSKNTDGEGQPLSALCITDTDTETNILSNTDTVISTRTDIKYHLTDTGSLVIVKSPTVTNPNIEKSQRRTKIGRNRKKRPMKMAIGRTTLTKIGKNKNIAKIKKSFC